MEPPFPPQPPARTLTSTGRKIATLQRGEAVREILQETMEAVVFSVLAVIVGSGADAEDISGVGILTGVVLMIFCADRLAVVCELIVRLNSIETEEDETDMTEQAFYTLGRRDEIMVIDAATMVGVDDDRAAYTVLIDREDGRWLILNAVTDNATQAARLLHRVRKQGRIDLTEWTDVSFLRSRLALNDDKALCIGRRPVLRGSHRPVHPQFNELSMLLDGDEARILRAVSPADPAKSWWLITLTLTEGIVLQHVLPFETSEEALELVKQIARAGAYPTDEFFDATDDESVQTDISEEIEIDQDGKPRLQ